MGKPIFRATLFGMTVMISAAMLASAQGQTYGYKKEEDPLILGVKKAIAQARKKDAEGLRRTIGELKWQIDELKEDVGVDLEGLIDRTLEAGDAGKIAYALTHLVYQALCQKFYWNEREKLARYVPARARLDAAQFYYEAILAHAVRRADRASHAERHRTILAHLRELRRTLGSPGLFGLGARAPELARFRRLSQEIERLLLEVYPDFTGREGRKPQGSPAPDEGRAPGPAKSGGGERDR